MSRIASRILTMPLNISVNIQDEKNGRFLIFDGPLGVNKSCLFLSSINIFFNNREISTIAKSEDDNALAGTYNSLIMNMIIGVTTGFKKNIKIKGSGYRVNIKNGNYLEFFLGKSHSDVLKIPELISVKIISNNSLELSSVDKAIIGNFSSFIRNLKKPNVYKEKGIYFSEEEGKIKIKKKKSAK